MNFFAKRTVKQQLSLLENRVGVKPSTVRRMVFIHDIELDITEAKFTEMVDFFHQNLKRLNEFIFT